MSELSLTPADRRVFDRLSAAVDAFDLGMTEVPALIEDVATLLDQFEEVPTAFAEELRQLWWPLQYALALSRDQERGLSDEEDQQARDTIAVLAHQLADLELS